MSEHFTLPYPPLLNRLYRSYGNRVVKSNSAVAYAETAGYLALAAGAVCHTGAVLMTLDVYRPRKSGDIDGVLKVLLDALEGVCYLNDKQIVDLHIRRFDDKRNPRVEVTIEEVIA